MNGRTLKKWLLEKYEHADGRIKAGDLDLDDRLHTVRTATGELLRIYFSTEPRDSLACEPYIDHLSGEKA